jgi:hypothetical protein
LKQPPRTLLLVAALLALFFVPAPGLESGPGGPPVQGPLALASALEDTDLGLASSFHTVSARRAGDGPALPAAAWLLLPLFVTVAGFRQVPSRAATRAEAFAKLRGPPAGSAA